jgi:uncharacterized membrane protein
MVVVSPLGRQLISCLELDVLRGIAAVLMIINHSGYRLLTSENALHSVMAPAVFLGSAAPAVFFFATGFGIGLSRAQVSREFNLVGLLWKATLLLAADQFFYWSRGVSVGLDFFSFTAISTIVVSLLSQLRSAQKICIVFAALLVLSRYGLAPFLKIEDLPLVVEWMLGARGIQNVSYPFSPWMVFPLVGFACGFSYKDVMLSSSQLRNDWIRNAAVAFILCSALGLVMFVFNRGFFRWGTVSVAYLVFASGVVIFAGLSALALVKFSAGATSALSLRGVASFLVIPLHYSLLEAVTLAIGKSLSPISFSVITLLVTVFSFFLAAKGAAIVSRCARAKQKNTLYIVLLALVITLVLAANIEAVRNRIPVALISMAGQVALAMLLGVGLPLHGLNKLGRIRG